MKEIIATTCNCSAQLNLESGDLQPLIELIIVHTETAYRYETHTNEDGSKTVVAPGKAVRLGDFRGYVGAEQLRQMGDSLIAYADIADQLGKRLARLPHVSPPDVAREGELPLTK